MKYFDELKRTMEWLAEKQDVLFLGQAVGDAGTAISNTLKDIDPDKRIELPVFESTQMGMSLGMSLEGFCPVTVFPRLNFLLCAMDQLVNHVDKYPVISEFKARMIIRSSIGSERPLHPSYQHVGDFTDAIRMMCSTVEVVKLNEPEEIFDSYRRAYEKDGVTLLVEWADYFNEK